MRYGRRRHSKYGRRGRHGLHYGGKTEWKERHQHTSVIFHDISASFTVSGVNSIVTTQSFVIAPVNYTTPAPPLGTQFTTLYANLDRYMTFYEEYKISGCKVSVHMQRQESLSDLTLAKNPICYIWHDPYGIYNDRGSTDVNQPGPPLS